MKTFRQILEGLQAGNFYRDGGVGAELIKIVKIEGGKLHLQNGVIIPKGDVIWTGKKKDGQGIWVNNPRRDVKKNLGKLSGASWRS
jgi:hypothetical protein